MRLSAQADSAALTQPGSIAGTPAFMSPEQAAGQIDGLGPASDVYSLGAVLYVLLTGRQAFGGRDLLNLLADVRLGQFAPPRQVNRSAPAALEAVCLKAMALQPEARYASAKELAADVERWLADEPVRAYREPWTVRLGRWARRNKTKVTGLGVLLATATTALAVGLVLVSQEKEQTRLALERSQKAEKKESEQRQSALEQRQQGDGPEALASYREALAIDRRLAEADPHSAHAQRDLTVSLDRVGQVQREQGDDKGALATYQECHAILKRLAEAEPRSAEAQRDLCVSLQRIGDLQLKQGDAKAALESYRECHGILKRLADADPHSAPSQRDLVVAFIKLGDVQVEQGDGPGALDSYREALRATRRLAKADPDSAEAQRDLGVSLSRVGNVQSALGDGAEALASYREALAIDRRFAAADPKNAEAQRDLSVSLSKVGNVQREQGDDKGALASFQECHGILKRLADADPRSAEARRDLLIICYKLGGLAERSSDFRRAADWYGQALDAPRRFARPEAFKDEVLVVEAQLRFCRAAEQALDDLAVIDQHPAEERPELLSAVSKALVRRKEFAKAVRAAEMMGRGAGTAPALYEAACAHSRCAPLAEQPAAREQLAAQAVDLLRRAVGAGFQDAARLKKDADLDPLRRRTDFQKLLAEVEKSEPRDKH
jgi:tetratricopeptide (TPR) repeat protein